MSNPRTASGLVRERMAVRATHVFALLCALAIMPVRAADSGRARRADERREDAAVKEAREAVNDAEREVRQAQQSLQRSQSPRWPRRKHGSRPLRADLTRPSRATRTFSPRAGP